MAEGKDVREDVDPFARFYDSVDTYGIDCEVCLPAIAAKAERMMRRVERVRLGHAMGCSEAGFYVLYYVGGSSTLPHVFYNGLVDHQPIYIGKAKSLRQRIREHQRSIQQAHGIAPADFEAIVVPMNIAQAEACETALIAKHQPLWNTVIMGFGNHNPGARRKGAKSRWDMLHEGRAQAEDDELVHQIEPMVIEILRWCEERCMLPVWYQGNRETREGRMIQQAIYGDDVAEFHAKMGAWMK